VRDRTFPLTVNILRKKKFPHFVFVSSKGDRSQAGTQEITHSCHLHLLHKKPPRYIYECHLWCSTPQTSYDQLVRPRFPHYVEFSVLQSSTRVRSPMTYFTRDNHSSPLSLLLFMNYSVCFIDPFNQFFSHYFDRIMQVLDQKSFLLYFVPEHVPVPTSE